MLERLVSWLSALTFREALWRGVMAAAGIEALTCVLRFGVGMTAGESTRWMAGVTCGWRVHHGYIGFLLIMGGLLLRLPGLRSALLIAGVGLFLSDLVHHFAVLWPLTDSPEFYLRYPD